MQFGRHNPRNNMAQLEAPTRPPLRGKLRAHSEQVTFTPTPFMHAPSPLRVSGQVSPLLAKDQRRKRGSCRTALQAALDPASLCTPFQGQRLQAGSWAMPRAFPSQLQGIQQQQQPTARDPPPPSSPPAAPLHPQAKGGKSLLRGNAACLRGRPRALLGGVLGKVLGGVGGWPTKAISGSQKRREDCRVLRAAHKPWVMPDAKTKYGPRRPVLGFSPLQTD